MITRAQARQYFAGVVAFFLLYFVAVGFAFTPPTSTPPNGNDVGPITTSSIPQAKGGPVVAGSLLDINGAFSTDYVRVDGEQARFLGTLQVGSLAGLGTRKVCVDANHKFFICPGQSGSGNPSPGIAVNAIRYCGTPVVVYTSSETYVSAGVHVWTDPDLQIPVPVGWGYIQSALTSGPDAGKAWSIVPGNYTNSSKLGPEVVPC